MRATNGPEGKKCLEHRSPALIWWMAHILGAMRRRILLTGIILSATAAAVAVIVLGRTDFNQYRSEIAHLLSGTLGREVQIHGPLALQIGFTPRVRVEGVTLANAPGQSPAEMAKIGQLWLEMDLWQLLKGKIEFRDLRVRDADILLEWSREGRPNWPSSGSTPRDEADSGGLGFELRNLETENLTLRLHHVASGSLKTARLEHLSIASEGEGLKVAAAGVLEGVPFDLSGSTGGLTDLVSGKAASPIDLKGKVFGLDVAVSGTIGGGQQRGDFDVRVSASAPESAPITQRIGLELPELGPIQGSGNLSGKAGIVKVSEISLEVGQHRATGAKVTGEIGDLLQLRAVDLDVAFRSESLHRLAPIGPVEISGRLEGNREQAKIRGIRASLYKTLITGEVQGSFGAGARPHLTARLESPSIHLDDVGLAPREEGSAGISRPAAEPPESEALPFDRLRGLDADISIHADRVVGRDDFLLEHVALTLKLADGDLELGPATLAFEGGSFTGNARIDARPDPPKLSLDLEGTEMHLGSALAQLQERPVATGIADLSLQLESRGASFEALRAGLGGDASLAIRGGQLHMKRMGLVAQGVFRSLYRGTRHGVVRTAQMVRGGDGEADAANADSKPIQCFAGHFEIDKGVATARVLALDTGEAVMLGTGQIDLVQERYDIHIEPKVKQRSILAVTVPLEIQGPLNQPKVSPRLLGAARSTATGVLGTLTRPAARILPFVDEGLWDQESCADLREALSR